VQGVGAAVDAGLGLGVARELAQDLAHLLLDLGEGGLGLGERLARDTGGRGGRLADLFIVDGGA
jgi:hypothetical protein